MPCYNTTTHICDNSGIIIDIVILTDAIVYFISSIQKVNIMIIYLVKW
jgi:hypothetical protein